MTILHKDSTATKHSRGLNFTDTHIDTKSELQKVPECTSLSSYASQKDRAPNKGKEAAWCWVAGTAVSDLPLPLRGASCVAGHTQECPQSTKSNDRLGVALSSRISELVCTTGGWHSFLRWAGGPVSSCPLTLHPEELPFSGIHPYPAAPAPLHCSPGLLKQPWRPSGILPLPWGPVCFLGLPPLSYCLEKPEATRHSPLLQGHFPCSHLARLPCGPCCSKPS